MIHGAARALERVLWGAIHAWRASGHILMHVLRRVLCNQAAHFSQIVFVDDALEKITSSWNGLHGSRLLHMIFCCVAQHVLDQQFAQLHHADGMRTSGADAKQHQNLDDLTLDEMLEAKRGSMLEQTRGGSDVHFNHEAPWNQISSTMHLLK